MRSARYCQKMFVRSIEVGDNSAGMCNITELRQPENEREAVVRARVTSFAGVVASNRIGFREGCGADFKNIERALDRPRTHGGGRLSQLRRGGLRSASLI